MIATETPRSALWRPERRNFTAGLVLIVTLAAFEAMGLSTALPTIVREMHAEQWYSWPFTTFMAASAIGTVLAGQVADRRGPAMTLLAGMPIFAVGLVVAGAAHEMPVLLLARVLQGFGGGAQTVALYVMIARVFPERDRPAAFGALSAAWVVPALLGPAIAGLLTEHLSWRWIFLGLAPLVALGAVLVTPTARRVGGPPPEPSSGSRGLPLAAAGAAAGVAALSWAAQHPTPLSLALAAVALVVVVVSLRVLLPRGTLVARPGIPVLVLARGVLAGTFFGAQAFVPLTLSVVHGYSPSIAGIPLTVGSLGWSAGAYWQSKQRERRREHLVAAGLVLVGSAVCGLTLISPDWGPHWLVFLMWPLAGAGMGIAMASMAVRVLALSDTAQQGFNSAALQISDMLGQSALVGFGGAVVGALATVARPTSGVLPVDLMLAALALVMAVVVARSVRPRGIDGIERPTDTRERTSRTLDGR